MLTLDFNNVDGSLLFIQWELGVHPNITTQTDTRNLPSKSIIYFELGLYV